MYSVTRTTTAVTYSVPTDEYVQHGRCYGCLDERDMGASDPYSHTCGLGAPVDGIIVTVRSMQEAEDNPYNLLDLPF